MMMILMMILSQVSCFLCNDIDHGEDLEDHDDDPDDDFVSMANLYHVSCVPSPGVGVTNLSRMGTPDVTASQCNSRRVIHVICTCLSLLCPRIVCDIPSMGTVFVCAFLGVSIHLILPLCIIVRNPSSALQTG